MGAVLACVLATPALAQPSAPQRATTALVTQWLIAGQPAMKILVKEDGWYRISARQVLKYGFTTSTPSQLQLYNNGVEVPIAVKKGFMEFYGTGLDTPTTDTNVYWLVNGSSAGRRIPVTQAAATGAPLAANFAFDVVRKPRLYYEKSILNGALENFFGPFLGPGSAPPQTIPVQNLDPASTAGTVEVGVQGLSLESHTIAVSVNGASVGSFTFFGKSSGLRTFAIPGGVLVEGNNTVTATPTGGPNDFDFLDRIKLTYQHLYRADGGTLSFSVPAGQGARVTGFTSPQVRLLDITDPANPTELRPTIQPDGSGYSLTVADASAFRKLLALHDTAARNPAGFENNVPSALNAATNHADFLIVSHRSFSSAVAPLVSLRTSVQGGSHDVLVADVQDALDEFSYGIHRPEGLKEFLRHASSTAWSLPRPANVLLFGDASADPRNYLNAAVNPDFVPTKLVDTQFTESPSDDWLVDFDDNDVPNVAIGRIAAKTLGDAQTQVSKIVGYEQQAPPVKEAVLVSDRYDAANGYDFEDQNEQLVPVIPAAFTLTRVKRGAEPSDAAYKAKIMSELNAGPYFVNYFGHGSPGLWAGSPAFTINDAATLTNGSSLSVFSMMTCLNGYFVDPLAANLGLAEVLMSNPNGGAVAVWASSGDTFPQAQVSMSKEALDRMFNNSLSRPQLAIGEAIKTAKQLIADRDVRRTWILFGDPTMKLR